MPLADRDYMRPSPPPRRAWGGGSPGGFWYNPVWVIIMVNFVLYLATVVLGTGVYEVNGSLVQINRVYYYLGLMPEEFLQRPWTLLTYMFVHAGFGHFIVNMITLFFFGRFFSRLVGQGRLLLVYFVGGIIASIFYLLLNISSSIPLVGASGAVFALAGAMVMMVPRLRVMVYFIVPMPLWVVVIIFFGLLSIPTAPAGIAWQAHLGGLVIGLVAGYVYKKRLRLYYYR